MRQKHLAPRRRRELPFDLAIGLFTGAVFTVAFVIDETRWLWRIGEIERLLAPLD